MKKVTSMQYEAPTTEVFVMNLEVSILTASPAPAPTPGPAAGVTGSGFHFNEATGNW